MPEPAEAADTQASPPAPDAPVAEIVRGPGGRFQSVRKTKRGQLPTLSDRMAVKEREQREQSPKPSPLPDDEEPEASSEAEPSEPAKPTNGSTLKVDAPKPDKPEEKPAARRETVSVDKPDFTKERLEFSEWKRKQREGLDAELRRREHEHSERMKAERTSFEEERGKFTPRMEKAERVLKLMETADYEALAKEAGYEDWDKFQGHVLGTLSDPNYKRVRELERQVSEREARDKAEREAAEARSKTEREEAETRARQQERAEAIRQHKQGLAQTMGKSQDRVVATLSEDPYFVDVIFQIQAQNYDPSTDSTVTPEQAVKMALRGAPRTLLETITLQRDRLNKALGEAVAAGAEAAAPSPTAADPAKPKPPGPKTAVVPGARGVEPSASGKWEGGAKGKAWRAYRDQELSQAFDEEEKMRLERKSARR
jgi:hypothetical protein